jgi:hypothetical protein
MPVVVTPVDQTPSTVVNVVAIPLNAPAAPAEGTPRVVVKEGTAAIESVASDVVRRAMDSDDTNDPAGLDLPDFRLYFNAALI